MSFNELKEIVRELPDQDRHELLDFIVELNECEGSDFWSDVQWRVQIAEDDSYTVH